MGEDEYMSSLFESWAEHWQTGTPITVSAQQYGQRHYTPEEQNADFLRLVEEAKQMRA